MTAASLVVDGLGHAAGGRTVLDEVDLSVSGGIVAVLGANGAGKTTLLRHVATLLEPQSGRVIVDGLDGEREADRIEIRRRLGYLPQDVGAAPSARVFDVVDYLAVLKECRDERQRRVQVADALEAVGLRQRWGDRVDALSVGMRRRLGLAQALLGSPKLLVLDEPASGLDPDERQRVRRVLADRRRDATVLMATHLTDDAADADLVVVLAEGRVRFRGTPEALTRVAAGRAWLQEGLPPPGVRASWRTGDGRFRCLGSPPPGADLVAPRLEEGYLLTVGRGEPPASSL